MRQYELTVIFPLEEEQAKSGRELVLSDLAANGIEVVKTDEMGDRDLAYPIKKKTRAHYTLFTISADPAKILTADKAFKLNQNILKFLFVNIEE